MAASPPPMSRQSEAAHALYGPSTLLAEPLDPLNFL